MKWTLLIFGIVSNASASILIKVAMMPPRNYPTISDPVEALKNWPFWLGLLFYGLAFLLYAAALQRLPLNVAHPILTSGAIALVSVSSIIFFNEQLNWLKVLGILLVLAGVVLISRSTAEV